MLPDPAIPPLSPHRVASTALLAEPSTELNRRAGRDAQHDPLPGLEPLDCEAVVMASRDIVAGYATGGCDGVAAVVRRAAAPGSEAVLFEQMWRSRHAIANRALLTAGKLHSDKTIAKAARAALVKANSARSR